MANKCLEHKPTSQSVLFNGEFISLTAVSFTAGLSISHLSCIFSGKREPSVSSAKKIAKALAMDLGGFLRTLEDHVAYLKAGSTSTSPQPVEKSA